MEKFSLDEACERLRREKLHYQNAYEKLISGKTYSTLNGELEESTRRVCVWKKIVRIPEENRQEEKLRTT